MHHGHAALYATGQAHHAYLGVAGQRLADHRAGPGDEIEYAPGQGRLGDEAGKLEGIVRGFAAGLDDDGVAGNQRGRHLAHDQKKGKVPGQDAGYDADGHLVEQDVFAGAVALDDLTLVAAGKLRHVLQVIGRKIDLDLCQRENLALLFGNDAGQRLAVGADKRGNLPQVDGAADGGQRGPLLLRLLRGQHGPVHILGRAAGILGDNRLGCGVHHR